MTKGNRPHNGGSLFRGLLGLAGAVAFHVLFVGLIVFRLTPKSPPQPALSQGYAAVSLAMISDTSRLARPQSNEHSPAGSPQPKQPALAAPTAPMEVQTPLEAQPRPQPAIPPEPLVLSARQPLLAAQDLQSEPMPLHSQAAAPSTGASPPAAGTPDCQLAPVIQQALQKDPGVIGSLASLPRQSRSVANAVMLWEKDWTSKPQSAAPIAVIQTALKTAVAQAEASCRQQPMRGPQFITVTDGASTTVLVVGSGDWSWGQLLQ